jgi:hypothetical protein
MRVKPGHVRGLLGVVAGCFLLAQGVDSGAQPAVSSWQGQMQEDDRRRLAGLWSAWTRGLAEVRAAGLESVLQALGPVAVPPVEPLPGRPEPLELGRLPATGDYQCRIIRLGLRDDGWPRDAGVPLRVADWAPCRLAADRLGMMRFDMLAGAQRLHGRLWADGDRMIFLGALALESETGDRRYGDDPDRDALGVLRPLEDGHWRLELPWPRWQSNLMLVEIISPGTPAAAGG